MIIVNSLNRLNRNANSLYTANYLFIENVFNMGSLCPKAISSYPLTRRERKLGRFMIMLKMYSIGLWQKIVETSDITKMQEQNFETSLQPIKLKRYWRYTYLEIRETARVGETKQAVETIANPPETKAVYAKRVLKIPSLYYLKDLCTWKSS